MFKTIITGISVALVVLAGGAVLLFSWSSTGLKALSVPTGSMRPAIPPGSLVLVRRVPADSLKVGDVITYANPLNRQKTISHRIIKTYSIMGKIPAFVTKGDANKTADQLITEGSVVGKVVWHVPHVGGWLIWGKKPVGLLILIYIPAILLMIEEVKRLSDYLKLCQPYRLAGFGKVKQASRNMTKWAIGGSFSLALVLGSIFVWQPALALLRSNTVSLVHNRISVAARPVSQCSNNNNINISNSSSQTATSGNTSTTGNTAGGSTSSGSASNSNSTSINMKVNNC